MLEDRPLDIPYALGRVDIQDEFSQERVIDFKRDVIPRLQARLNDKLLSDYGERTALLIRQVGPLWIALDWQREAPEVVAEVLAGREKYYGKGVWILCSNTSTNPLSNDICPLFDPDVGIIERPTSPPQLQQVDGIVGKVSWEKSITADFLEFSNQKDVDPPVLIESPHGCEYVALIAFLRTEPEEERQNAINFYRAQMGIICPCGRGSARSLGSWVVIRE